jgi:ketosteroid isomerase-like protein
MTETSTPLFRGASPSGRGWELLRQQLVPRDGDASFEEVREELAVRDAVARYFYAFDQGDLEATMAMFVDEAELESPRGTVRGKEAVRAAYVDMMAAAHHRFHYLSNQVVRLSADLREAVVTSYHYALLAPTAGPPKVLGGIIADRLLKTSGGWRFAHRTTTVELSYDLDV